MNTRYTFLRRFLLSYLRMACFIVGFGCLLAAANVGRLAVRWRSSPDEPALLAGALAIGFTAAGGGLILLGMRAPWRRAGGARRRNG
jgi:hypothetical protein